MGALGRPLDMCWRVPMSRLPPPHRRKAPHIAASGGRLAYFDKGRAQRRALETRRPDRRRRSACLPHLIKFMIRFSMKEGPDGKHIRRRAPTIAGPDGKREDTFRPTMTLVSHGSLVVQEQHSPEVREQISQVLAVGGRQIHRAMVVPVHKNVTRKRFAPIPLCTLL